MATNNNIPYELSDYVLGKYFHDAGIKQGWLPENGNHIALAVSGGGDSIALLWMFSKFYHAPLTAIHINHGIRGAESDGDEAFTAMIAAEMGASFHSVRVNVPSEREKGESIESAARRIRREALIISARQLGINAIMLGHNRDDLAETVLFNILRGTGIRGGVGMTESTHAQGITFYRPLLGLRREFLRDILRARGLSWREDSTNNDTEYTRNYIRLKLIPMIESGINASAVEHLAQFGEDMRPIREREDIASREILASCLEDEYTLNMKILRSHTEDEIALAIRDMGRRLGLRTLSRKRCNELAGLIRRGGKFMFQWCGNMTVEGHKGKIYFGGSKDTCND